MSEDKIKAEGKDTADLARRYLDLWQRQVAAMATDPALVELARRFFQPFGAGDGADAATAGSAPAAAAPGDIVARLDEFARRLAACEERLAALEPGARGGGPGARPRARRRRS